MPGRLARCALCPDTCVYRSPRAVAGGRKPAMFTRLFSAIVGAGIGFAITAVPAYAADDIEAKAQMCDACHGQNGVPADPKTIPIIWGQQQSYLVKQLRDYRNGERDNPIMSPNQRPCAGGSAQDRGLFRGQELAGATCDRRSRVAAQRNRSVPTMPPAEFRGRPAGAAAGRAQLRIPGRNDARLRHRGKGQ